jgi:D-galactarolactone cycloisomerase
LIIKSIEAIGLKYQFEQNHAYGMARGLSSERGSTLVVVETDEGITGVGEAWGAGPHIIEQLKTLSNLFVGRNPFDREVILNKAFCSLYHLGLSGAHISALSGIDQALWDVIGKSTGQPVYNLLGGKSRDEIMAYASTGYITPSLKLDDLRPQIEKAVEMGFRALKIKIGIGPKEDRERVKLTREIAGDDVLLLVDANGNYTRESALRCAQMIEEFNIHWFEEPLSPEDTDGYRYLKEKTAIPLAAGEALFTRFGFRNFIAGGYIDFVQPDLSKCGGISEGKKIADLAQTWNLNVSAHVWGSAVGLAASLNFMANLLSHPHSIIASSPVLFEYDIQTNPLRTHLTQESITVKDGFIQIPDRPGLGVSVDEQFLKRMKREGGILTLTSEEFSQLHSK